ncbi:hypothetical protein PG996_000007 [Apiospora saccharicola]|uniref:PiggyBac transposable element-derived protein domain-containing protein n=1 Tax=Apiospora saccharicola TaxID=335842 RepID=A0ABR1WCH2_9PEZI
MLVDEVDSDTEMRDMDDHDSEVESELADQDYDAWTGIEGIISEDEFEDEQSGSPAPGSRARNPATPPPVSHGGLLTLVTESRHIRFSDDGLAITEQATVARTLSPAIPGCGMKTRWRANELAEPLARRFVWAGTGLPRTMGKGFLLYEPFILPPLGG